MNFFFRYFFLFVCFFLLPSVCASGSFVERSLPVVAAPATVFNVSLSTVVNASDTSYVIDERYPTGFVVVNAGGGDTSEAGHIKWIVLSGAESHVYQYSVRAPSLLDDYRFEGIYLFSQGYESSIVGDSFVFVDDPVRAYYNSHSVFYNTPTDISLYGTDDSALSFVITTLPLHGTLVDLQRGSISSTPFALSGNSVRYTPASGYLGPDDFSFSVNNGLSVGVFGDIFLDVVWKEYADYRTAIPAINASWWLDVHEPFTPRPVSRDDYYAYAKAYFNYLDSGVRAVAGRVDYPSQKEFARMYAFFHRYNDGTIASDAGNISLLLLNGSYRYYTEGPGMNESFRGYTVLPVAETYLWLRESGFLRPADENFMKSFLELLEYRHALWEFGPMNRALDSAFFRKLLTVWYPTSPLQSGRLAYIHLIWQYWWGAPEQELRDTNENAPAYNSLSFANIVKWVNAENASAQEAFYADEGVQDLFERYLLQTSPLGPIPHHGSMMGLNPDPGAWIFLFENAATQFHDGRYKFVAHRIFDWSVQQDDEMKQWGNIRGVLSDDLKHAWLAADDSIAEEKPMTESVVTYRKALDLLHFPPPGSGYFPNLTTTVIPDKLVLRDGWERDSLYALVELAPQMGHGHVAPGSFLFMSSNGSVLLTSSTYHLFSPQFHNSFLIEPTVPAAWNPDAYYDLNVNVPAFYDSGSATFARVSMPDYLHSGFAVERDIFFVKGGFVWVRDRAVADRDFSGTIGPAWQTLSVYGSQSDDFVNTAYQSIPVSLIFPIASEREPGRTYPAYVMQWDNYPWDLTIAFPSENGEMSIENVARDDSGIIAQWTIQNDVRYRIWNQEQVDLSSGETMTFDSLLLPHAPAPDSSDIVRDFTMLVDTDELSILQQRTDNGEILFGVNRDGGMIQEGLLETDADAFFVEIADGSLVRYWVYGATTFSYNGISYYNSAQDGSDEAFVSSEPRGGSSGGDSSSDSSNAVCAEQWSCDAWSTCTDGVERRSCFDIQECGTAVLRPVLERGCSIANATLPGFLQETFASQQVVLSLIVVLLSSVFVIIILIFFLHRHR